ncbi:MAG: VTT domain-containing protein [Gammaproteobacteria bacterium]|nr:VTT domain-containing protein [Gammaproteobacteria bacterium]
MKPYIKKLFFLSVLIITGIIFEIAGWLDPEKLLLMAREHADNQWLIVILIICQVVLFTFALAGSSFLWITAPVYSPAMSTFILVAGSTLGGISAYYFSRRLTDDWIHKVENSRVYKLLRKEDNFLSLFALRIMPAFPHALINYSSGILNIKLSHFIPATILGIGIKAYVFSSVIHQASDASSIGDLLDFSIYSPLLLISSLILLGLFIKYKYEIHKNKRQD